MYKIDCGGKVGSAIKIAQDGQYLTLCEVQVLGKFLKQFQWKCSFDKIFDLKLF